ncbi:transcriptional activator of glycolytic enzymes-domain-containing protein [Blakeslea trispora]|nr:transcriptional activator of glycolytic enzymes-domain-containing protein [Blakeslea trispora]
MNQYEQDMDLLRRVVPNIERRLAAIHVLQEEAFQRLSTQIDELRATVNALNNKSTIQVNLNPSSGESIQLNIRGSEDLNSPIPTSSSAATATASNSHYHLNPNPSQKRPALNFITTVPSTYAGMVPPVVTPTPNAYIASASQSSQDALHSSLAEPSIPAPPTTNHATDDTPGVTYRLNRNVRTIPDLHKEWTIGINGSPSIEYLNAHHKGWNLRDRTFYRRRRTLMRTIMTYASEHDISLLDAVQIAEANRLRNKKTLDFLSKNTKRIFA